jgi:putative oxidoreductase
MVMSYGLLFLRVVIGAIFLAHGTQKLLGWFGGPGLKGTRGWLGSLNFRLPAVLALLVALSESSGVLFALGLLTPFAALLMCSVMFVAIATVHWPNGFFNGSKGYEFNLSLLAAAVAVAAAGPGRFSLDRLIGWDDNLSGLWWGVGVLGASALGAALTLATMRRRQTPTELAAP